MKKVMLLAGLIFNTFSYSQEHNWGYNGDHSPEHWGEMENAQQCKNGKFQSPINIKTLSVTQKKLSKLIFNYGAGKVEKIVDNGHSLEFDFDGNSQISYNNKVYKLIQFHAHEESEHKIDGIRYPLELHFVHQSDDGAILVIGVMIKDGKENSYFEKLNIFKNLEHNDNLTTNIIFNPEKMFPKNKSYYQYKGSLTTPPCNEDITWIIFTNPITMTEDEIDEIGDHLPKHNNRPIQPLNGRDIILSKN